MENVIELKEQLKKPNTFIIICGDLLKFAKVVLIVGAVFAGVEGAKRGYAYAAERFDHYRTELVNAEVVRSLEGKTFEFNDKGVSKPATAMGRDELVRAMYLLEQKRQQTSQALAQVKEILSYEE